MNHTKNELISDIQTWLEHGEVGLVDGEQLKVRRELGHKTNESLVDLGIGSAVPARQDALLRGSQKELRNARERTG